jgi:hypothetical protein
MKMDTKDPTFHVTAVAIGVSILRQLQPAEFKGLTLEQIENEAELIERVRAFGASTKLDPLYMTSCVLSAQVQLLLSETHQRDMLEGLATLLWRILGNPEEGDQPPVIYKKAAQSMILSFVYFLCPAYIDNAND